MSQKSENTTEVDEHAARTARYRVIADGLEYTAKDSGLDVTGEKGKSDDTIVQLRAENRRLSHTIRVVTNELKKVKRIISNR
jgi:septation ring formation regulator EzrA